MSKQEGSNNEISGSVDRAVQAGVVNGDVRVGDVNIKVQAEANQWPCRVGSVPMRADCFQEREISAQLAEVVSKSGSAVVTPVLAGLGGVGKTQVAAQFAEEQWDLGQLDLLVWINATTRESIMSGYAAAAVRIGESPRIGGSTEEDAGQRFLDWLRETDCRWLIVLDDLQKPQDLQGLWPPQQPNGSVVVTTRRQEAALSGNGRRLVEVGLFTEREAITYLETRLADFPHLVDDTAALAADLGYLPMALAQAASFIADRRLTCANYRKRFADRRKKLDEVLPDPAGLPDDHARTVAATWSLSIELADELAPVGLASPLLDLASMLDPNMIPADVLTTPSVQEYLTSSRNVSRRIDADEVWDAMHNLRRLSLVTVDSNSSVQSVGVHALVQRATRDQLSDSQQAIAARVAADALVQAWPELETDTTLTQPLRANTDALRATAEVHLWTPDAHLVLFRAASSHGKAGHTATAARYFEDLHSDAERRLGPQHPLTLVSRGNHAVWRGWSGDARRAVELLEELLSDEYRLLGRYHPSTLRTRANLANGLGEAGAPDRAVEMLGELLADQEEFLDPSDPEILATRRDLAAWRGRAGDPRGAVSSLKDLLPAQQGSLGAYHPDTFSTRHGIATGLARTGDLEGAVEVLDELLADQERVLAPMHPDLLYTRMSLANVRGQAGDPSRAFLTLKELVADQRELLGERHRDTLRARLDLATWQGKSGDPHGAAKALSTLLDDQRRVLGRYHLDTFVTRQNIATCQSVAGNLRGALATLKKLLSDQREVLGQHHPDTFRTRHEIAYLQARSGDLKGAAAAVKKLLADQERELGRAHPDTVETREIVKSLRRKG